MPFRPYHTGLRKQIDFEPLDQGSVDEHGNRVRNVLMYNCGPTVYGVPHIGNYRSFLFADLLRRYLDWRVDDDGTRYRVTQVMNITDVGHLTEDDRADAGGEDKLQAMAEKLGWDPFKVARHFEDLFFADLDKLGVRRAHHYPRATEHVADMLDMIQSLLERGHAYVTESTGEVYFHVPSYPEYGKLSGKDIEANVAGARVEVLDVKRDPRDFALWKVDAKHLMQWDPHDPRLWVTYEKDTGRPVPKLDPRIGRGFPGWHIECSAMSRRYLGVTFDIHTGGEDNIFPHHECEIAQSVAANGKPFVGTWMHARHLLVDNKKMSKSAGTLYTLADLEAMKSRDGGHFTAADVRFALISQHYRQPMNFTIEGLEAARAVVKRMLRLRNGLARTVGSISSNGNEFVSFIRTGKHLEGDATSVVSPNLSPYIELTRSLFNGFHKSLEDDLNVSKALVHLFEFLKSAESLVRQGNEHYTGWLYLQRSLEAVDELLGILSLVPFVQEVRRDGLVDAEVELATPFQPGLLVKILQGLETNDSSIDLSVANNELLEQLVMHRRLAKKVKDFALADRIRTALTNAGVILEDTPQGVRWKMK